MNKFFDIFTPRFITEWVALEVVDGEYQIACSMRDVTPNESFPAKAQFRSFNFFGVALFPKLLNLVEKPFQGASNEL